MTPATMPEARPHRAAEALAGLPVGTVALAATSWRRAEGRLGRNGEWGDRGDQGDGAEQTVEGLLVAPLVLEPTWPRPTPPTPVGGGWVHCDVVEDDDEVLRAALARWSGQGPEAVAAACQELRLPVVPYRRPRPGAIRPTGATALDDGPAEPTVAGPDRPSGSLEGRLVVDLSTHWAGPLATALLAEAGATVVKIEPRARPDGFASRPAFYELLNGTKDLRHLDLRLAPDRAAFERLLSGADLLVESFSRRVLTNLGYAPPGLWAHGPRLSLLSIKAFPAGSREQDWLAYGPGVHATSGLAWPADDPTRAPIPAPVAYPDVLAALAAYDRAVSVLTTANGGHDAHEVSLAGAIEPLAAGPASGGHA